MSDFPFLITSNYDQYLSKTHGEVLPRNRFPIRSLRQSDIAMVVRRLVEQIPRVLREPQGVFRYPYVVPGSIYSTLWDWDGLFTGIAIGPEFNSYHSGTLLNILHHATEEGRPPKLIAEDGWVDLESMPVPVHAFWFAQIVRTSGEIDLLQEWWPVLKRIRTWYEKACRGRHGLFLLMNRHGHGIDNDPVIYTVPADIVAPIDVNCFHYLEYTAMSELAAALNEEVDAERYAKSAMQLRNAINYYMWDPVDAMYYHLLLPPHDREGAFQEITWEIPLKVRSWACVFPLWTGVSEGTQADEMIRRNLLDDRHFLSPFGLRSLSKCERVYNNQPMGRPCNWQGPVWGLPTFLGAYCLARHGYPKEATDLAGRLLAVFAADLSHNGVVHESYDSDSGAPLAKPGFLSWNLLATRIMDDLTAGIDPFRLGSLLGTEDTPGGNAAR